MAGSGAPHGDVPHLTAMLGTYFHSGWTDEHRAADDCLSRMLTEVPVAEQRRSASEIRRLLDGTLCESQIRDLLAYEVGCCYAFERDGYEASAWLRHVLNRIVGGLATGA